MSAPSRQDLPGVPSAGDNPGSQPVKRRLNAPNREQWLVSLVEAFRPTLSKVGEVPPFRIACGFPSRRAAARNRVVGQCWSPSRSADGTIEIFISPVLDDGFEVAHTALHELLHAVVGCEHGHRGPFKRAMRRVGLIGPPTASYPGDDLAALIRGSILPDLGPYPHVRLDPSARKVQGTRLLKALCEQCGYVARVTHKWIIASGPPLCPCNGEPMLVESSAP